MIKRSNLSIVTLLMILTGCSHDTYLKTVPKVDTKRFFTDWYVIASRPTSFEKGAHNAMEKYRYNEEKEQIDIDFTYRKDSFNGEKKSIPQTGWIYNKDTNAHWKVRPFWPLKFDYLIIGLAPDYSWTVVGVPDEKWVWIMSQSPEMSDETLNEIMKQMSDTGYDMSHVERVPQKWD